VIRAVLVSTVGGIALILALVLAILVAGAGLGAVFGIDMT